MAFGGGKKIPANSILRQETLLLGVPRQERQSETDPMQPAIDQIERALRAKDAAVMAEQRTGTAPPSSGAATRKPSERT